MSKQGLVTCDCCGLDSQVKNMVEYGYGSKVCDFCVVAGYTDNTFGTVVETHGKDEEND